MDDSVDSVLDQMNLPPEMEGELRQQIATLQHDLVNGMIVMGIAIPIILALCFWAFHLLQKKKALAMGTYNAEVSKRYWISSFLCAAFGFAGLHRFYLGRWFSGFLMLITLGGLGIWQLFDIYQIMSGRFYDSKNNLVSRP